ncbi:GntR family transcriptional regulator [Haloactinopolyspora sp.]|uniref:GntR family transcriptional regulator n=1 Tax=Haloactinopolyspora sp. TaxID=1966353 RepID=UPI0026348CB8|nr:GntR family transcriptional regulator [Haloactinopolyspora sp.]
MRGTVADDLRRAIVTGDLAPGESLPTEKDLIARYGVSRNTVRSALSALENEGLITSSQGRGRRVRKREPVWIYASRSESHARRRPMGVDSWVDDMRSQGREPRTDIEVAVVHAPVEVSERLKLDNGALVAVRRRTRFADDQPWNLNDSYYPMWLAQEVAAILDPADMTPGLTVHLADHGYVQEYYNDELTCRMPTPEEAQALNIGVGIPVMCHTRTGSTKDGPIRVTITIMPGDRHRLLYEVPA